MRERFHYPSFRWYVTQKLQLVGVAFYIRNWSLVVISYDESFSQGELQDIIIECILACIDAPHGAPDRARQRALLDAPLSAHCEALENALLVRRDYIQKRGVKSTEGITGEEFNVNLKRVNEIIVEVRTRKDVDLVAEIIEGDKTISYRSLQDKLKYRLGVYFSNPRIAAVMKGLDKRGKTERNGKLRTYGRDIIA